MQIYVNCLPICFLKQKKQTEMIKITALAKEKSNNSKYLSISYHIATKHKNQF